ncbi:hypothetical protein EDB80DRAFT_841969 [Ilyonectria destructans]|nr:hypothetical protein EDB80DRAFT_841969 [Ilyonectria destructans]
MQANVYTPVSPTTALLPHLPTYGGRVVNLSSCASKQANSDPIITHGASKATLDSIMRSFADNFAKEKGATFNSVIVGPTATDASPLIYSPTYNLNWQEDIPMFSAHPELADNHAGVSAKSAQ